MKLFILNPIFASVDVGRGVCVCVAGWGGGGIGSRGATSH